MKIGAMLDEKYPLKYLIACRLVGYTPVFSKKQTRRLIFSVINQVAIKYDVLINHIVIFDYAVKYQVNTKKPIELRHLVLEIERLILRKLDFAFPDLQINQMFDLKEPRFCWHVPFYLRSLPGDDLQVKGSITYSESLDDYLSDD